MIEVDGLTKRFGAATAVAGLSFSVRPGRVTGFLGPNGAGKTTTLRMILGLSTPTAGRALIGDRPYASLDRPLRTVGALLDPNALHPARRAGTHLATIARSNGIGRARVPEVLRLTGLEAVARQPAGPFSLGMRQRLGIATALLGDPAVLIFDEPANGLDTDGIRWLRALLRSLAGEGRTVLVSSHLMSEIAMTADHLIVIGRGRLLADQPTAEFIAARSSTSVFVGTPSVARLAEVLKQAGAEVTAQDGGLSVTGLAAPAVGDLALAAGVAVHELVIRQASLEDAYVDVTEKSVEYKAGAES
jgi:ABC-2 type transport system ATP-binding protein